VVGQSQLGTYPLCLSTQETGGNLGHVQVAVHASTREAPVNNASARRVNSGMAIWTALIIHMIGAEIYVSAGAHLAHDLFGREGTVMRLSIIYLLLHIWGRLPAHSADSRLLYV
jgi:hypothetical protein